MLLTNKMAWKILMNNMSYYIYTKNGKMRLKVAIRDERKQLILWEYMGISSYLHKSQIERADLNGNIMRIYANNALYIIYIEDYKQNCKLCKE